MVRQSNQQLDLTTRTQKKAWEGRFRRQPMSPPLSSTQKPKNAAVTRLTLAVAAVGQTAGDDAGASAHIWM